MTVCTTMAPPPPYTPAHTACSLQTVVVFGPRLCMSLQNLDLSWNGLGVSGTHLTAVTEAICAMVQGNTTLVHLDVSHNNLPLTACAQFGEALRRNQTIM